MFVTLAILDLQQLLSEKTDKYGNPLDLPRELILQFDNCPENKVSFKICLCYASAMFNELFNIHVLEPICVFMGVTACGGKYF